MRHKVHSRVGAKNMDTSGYHLTDLEDIGFHWEDPDLNMDAVFRPGNGTHFSPTAFDSLEKGGSVENAFVLDDEENEKNLLPTTAVSERPNKSPALLRSRPFEKN